MFIDTIPTEIGSNLKIINPLESNSWDNWILETETYSFFHSSGWTRVLYESYGYKPLYFVFADKNCPKILLPLMEVNSFFTGKRGVSLPFSDYCQPIVKKEANFKEALEIIIDYGRHHGWKYIEIRGGKNIFKYIPSFSKYYIHNLDLSPGENKIFSSFRDSTKRNIKKARRKGVEVKISRSFESIKKFYKLNCITRKMHGLPPQPFYFFKKIYEFIISRNRGIVVLAYYNRKAVAAAVFFHFGRKALFKYSASDKEYHYLRPNNLVLWEGIKWYLKNGLSSISLGRTDVNNKGLKQYKSGWGAKEEILEYYRFNIKDTNSIENSKSIFPISNEILKKTPLPILRLMGLILYKHLG